VVNQNYFTWKNCIPEKKKKGRKVIVAHVCNPSYLGIGDQEDDSLKTIQAKVSKTPSQQITCAWCAHL
jgi:hypothetical protein